MAVLSKPGAYRVRWSMTSRSRARRRPRRSARTHEGEQPSAVAERGYCSLGGSRYSTVVLCSIGPPFGPETSCFEFSRQSSGNLAAIERDQTDPWNVAPAGMIRHSWPFFSHHACEKVIARVMATKNSGYAFSQTWIVALQISNSAAIWTRERPLRPSSTTFSQYSGLYNVGLPAGITSPSRP